MPRSLSPTLAFELAIDRGPFERVRCRSAELGGSISEIEIGAKKWTGTFDFFWIFSQIIPATWPSTVPAIATKESSQRYTVPGGSP
jgi:hypothetical protein